MTDRELLENAAKAAGINLAPEGNEVGPAHFDGVGLVKYSNSGFVTFKWYPLTDDGDALRLAVKVKIDIAHFSNFVRADVSGHDDCHESNGEDACASLRRAIVRSAASVGESL